MMFSKKIFALGLCSFLSSFSAFEDPFEADKASQNFIVNNPNFPAKNMITVISYKEGERMLAMGSGVALNSQYILTSCHHNYILDAKTSVWVTLSPGRIPINPDNSNLDLDKAKQDKSFYHCTNRYCFSKVSMGEKNEPIRGRTSTLEGLLESLRDTLSETDFSIRNGGTVINTPNDILLLKLERPMEVISIPLSPTPSLPETVNVYGLGSQIAWHFADGKKSMDGKTFTNRDPLPKIFEQPDHLLSPMVTRSEEGIHGHHRPQVFVETLRTVPGKPKAFGCFERLKADDDESWKRQSSLAYHNTSPEYQDLLAPCVGGMSGCPVFTKEKDTFSLFGLMSSSSPLSAVIPSDKKVTHFTLNIFQTFTPELVEKINKVMDRPEPEAKP